MRILHYIACVFMLTGYSLWAGVALNSMMRQVIYINNTGDSDLYVFFDDHDGSPLADMIPIHAGEHKLMYTDAVSRRPLKVYYLNCSNNQYRVNYHITFDASKREARLTRDGYVVDTLPYEPLQGLSPYILVDDDLDATFYRELDDDSSERRSCWRHGRF
jgi:hypothetical protein